MKHNRIIALLLALLLMTVLLTGCSQPEEKTGEKDDDSVEVIEKDDDLPEEDPDQEPVKENDYQWQPSQENVITTHDELVAFLEPFVDFSKYEYSPPDEDEMRYSSHYYSRSYEHELEYSLDYGVELFDGTAFTMPVTVSELEAAGWKIQNPTDQTMEPGFMTWTNLENAAEQTIYVTIYNHTEAAVGFADCMVIGVELLPETVGFTVCGQISETATLEDILRTLGEPSTIWYALYDRDEDGNYESVEIELSYENSARNYITFTLSGSHTIEEVDYSVEPA